MLQIFQTILPSAGTHGQHPEYNDYRRCNLQPTALSKVRERQDSTVSSCLFICSTASTTSTDGKCSTLYIVLANQRCYTSHLTIFQGYKGRDSEQRPKASRLHNITVGLVGQPAGTGLSQSGDVYVRTAAAGKMHPQPLAYISPGKGTCRRGNQAYKSSPRFKRFSHT